MLTFELGSNIELLHSKSYFDISTGAGYRTLTFGILFSSPGPKAMLRRPSVVDHDLFYGKVKFGNIGFSIEQSENTSASMRTPPTSYNCI